MLNFECLIKMSPFRKNEGEVFSLKGVTKFLAFSLLFCLMSCGPNTLWTFDRDILLEEADISPNGITMIGDQMWIADTDNNRLVRIDDAGGILEEIEELDRPMHLNQANQKLIVPEYGSDLIRMLNSGVLDTVALTAAPDAPASADISGDRIVVADFYNHRVIYELAG